MMLKMPRVVVEEAGGRIILGPRAAPLVFLYWSVERIIRNPQSGFRRTVSRARSPLAIFSIVIQFVL